MRRLNNHAINNGDVGFHPSYFLVEFNSESVPDPYTTPIKSTDYDKMKYLLKLFQSEYDEYLLDVDIQMLQDWLVVSPTSTSYIVSTVLFHVAVTKFISKFSMFVPTKATVKPANGNMGHAQGIGIISFRFPNCSIIYLVGPAYYFLGHHYLTITPGTLKIYFDFQKVTSEPL